MISRQSDSPIGIDKLTDPFRDDFFHKNLVIISNGYETIIKHPVESPAESNPVSH